MSILGLIYVLLLTVLIALFFNYGLSIKGPWGTLWTFFLVIFFAILVAHIWFRPLGPKWHNLYWLPPLGVGILIALLLAAATPPRKISEKNIAENPENVDESPEDSSSIAVGYFFWVLLIILIVVALLGLFQLRNYT